MKEDEIKELVNSSLHSEYTDPFGEKAEFNVADAIRFVAEGLSSVARELYEINETMKQALANEPRGELRRPRG